MVRSARIFTCLVGLILRVHATLDISSAPVPSHNFEWLNERLEHKPLLPGKISYLVTNTQGFALEFSPPFPVRGLAMNEIMPVVDQGQTMCCPPGTVFDSQSRSCVFKASSLCPKDFNLDQETMSICIRKDPPCPGSLTLQDGLCVSHDLPGCTDQRAKYNETTHHCEAILEPVCPSPLSANGNECVSATGPTCDEGFNLINGQCELIGALTCGSPEDGLTVKETKDKDNKPKLICISTTKPECAPETRPDNGECIRDEGPQCKKGYVNKEGECIYEKGPCEKGGKFTTFDDNREPACLTEADAQCTDGTREGSSCVSNSKPCGEEKEGFKLIDKDTCRRFTEHNCPAETEPVLAPADSRRGQDRPQNAFCCPSGIEGMTIDNQNRCSFESKTEDCPNGMTRDPQDSTRCIYQPKQADCTRGALKNLPDGSWACEETTPASCANGTPDAVTGKCNLGKPNCDKLGSNYKYNDKTKMCVSEVKPECPPEAETPLVNIGDCISKEKSTCPSNAPHSLDKTKCVHREPPDCKGKGTYDNQLNRCVADSKPVCNPPNGVGKAVIDGTRCISPTLPACDPKSGTQYDQMTTQCVGTKTPKCESEDFRLDQKLGRCVLVKGPTCDHVEKPGGPKFIFNSESGKCTSTSPPECPKDSTWRGNINVCVSNFKPCSEGGTPDKDGRCASAELPKCDHIPNTKFEPGIGCVSNKITPDCPTIVVRGESVKMTLDPDTKNCIAKEGPTCGDMKGLRVVGNQCVSTEFHPECPKPSKLDDAGRCVAATPPDCGANTGLRFDEKLLLCAAKPTCGSAETLDEKIGKCVKVSQRTCFVLLSCPDVVDDTMMLDTGPKAGTLGGSAGAGAARLETQ